MQQSFRDRLLGALGAAFVVAMLGYILLFGLPIKLNTHQDPPVTIVSLQTPRMEEHQTEPRIDPPKHRHASARQSPPNRKSQTTIIVTPPPLIRPPTPLPERAALKAGEGAAVSSGQSDLAGPGVGAGGRGESAGNGGDGYGDGSGNTPPRLIKGRVKGSDLPRELNEMPIEGFVSVSYDVGTDGRVSNCVVTRSIGIAELDRLTCALIEQRFRYAPERSRDGEPIASTVEEDHHWHNSGMMEPPLER